MTLNIDSEQTLIGWIGAALVRAEHVEVTLRQTRRFALRRRHRLRRELRFHRFEALEHELALGRLRGVPSLGRPATENGRRAG